MQRPSIKSKKRIPKKYLLITLFAVIGISIILTVLEVTNTTNIFHKEPASSLSDTTADSPSKGEKKPSKDETPKNESEGTPSTNTGTEEKTSEQPATPSPTAQLAAPHGDFVSSHRVGKNTMITSVCTTTPGAKCEIIFTMNLVQKTLSVEQTDSSGNVYWDWKPSDIGLSSGTWKITAKSTLGNQTQTASDVIPLEVSND